jgi:hypothetical protein
MSFLKTLGRVWKASDQGIYSKNKARQTSEEDIQEKQKPEMKGALRKYNKKTRGGPKDVGENI